jgi:hypothetical protein
MAGLITLWPKHRTNKAQQDTFDDPELARKEVIKAFQLMEYSLNIGREHLKLAEDITNESMNTLDNALETLKTLATGTHNGMSLGGETSKISGEKLLTNSPEIGPMLPPEKYYVVIPSGYNIYDVTLPNDPITDASFTKVTDVIINNHNIYIFNTKRPTISGLEIY